MQTNPMFKILYVNMTLAGYCLDKHYFTEYLFVDVALMYSFVSCLFMMCFQIWYRLIILFLEGGNHWKSADGEASSLVSTIYSFFTLKKHTHGLQQGEDGIF